VNRRVGRASLALALGYDHTTYLQSQDLSAKPGIDYLTSSLSLSMPLIGDRMSASIFGRYHESVSDEISQSWNGFQTGCSLSYQF